MTRLATAALCIASWLCACSQPPALSDEAVHDACKRAVHDEAGWLPDLRRLARVTADTPPGAPSGQLRFTWSQQAGTLSPPGVMLGDARREVIAAECLFDTNRQRVAAVAVQRRGGAPLIEPIMGNRF